VFALSGPYHFEDDAYGSIAFCTRNGLRYSIYFIEEQESEYLTYFPELAPLALTVGLNIVGGENVDAAPDPRIGETVAFVLCKYFDQNQDGLLWFFVDSADGKQAARKRIFQFWYSKAGINNVVLRIEALEVGEEKMYFGVLFSANHQFRNLIDSCIETNLLGFRAKN
jgi:hypothetical protein